MLRERRHERVVQHPACAAWTTHPLLESTLCLRAQPGRNEDMVDGEGVVDALGHDELESERSRPFVHCSWIR